MTRMKKILVIGIPVLIAIGVAATMWSGADKKFPVVTVQKASRPDLREIFSILENRPHARPAQEQPKEQG